MPDLEARLAPVLAVELRKGDVSLKFFSGVTTLGTAQDITLQELRIECVFPSDEVTEQRLKNLVSRRGLEPRTP